MDAWAALALQPQIGLKTLRALVARFGSAEAVLEAAPADLMQVAGVGKKTAQVISAINMMALENLYYKWSKQGVTLLTPDHPAWPAPLYGLEDAPPILFVRGKPHLSLWTKTAAVVGTRSPEFHMQTLTQGLTLRLATEGYTVISGLALGVDTCAHIGALAATRGRTVAVMGSGVLNVYPHLNRELAQQVAAHGLVVSEVTPPTEVSAAQLVARNRIISGLAHLLIVVQTDKEGGAMYAAKAAMAQGRPVYTVDLPYSGNQLLLEQGAGRIPAILAPWPF